MAVVKDSAYGNGASIIASVLENEGKVDFFVVANADEAFALRNASIRGDILVLGKASQEQLCLGAQKRITFTCNDPNDLERWTHYDIPIPIDFHVNIDTGMRRLGFTAAECSILISTLETNPHLQCKGCFTHMACADEPGTSTVDRQYEAFEKTIPILKGAGIDLRYIHASNSAALLRFFLPAHVRMCVPESCCTDAIRPCQSFGIDLHTVVSLKGRVVSLREVAEGTPVSYGGNYVTKERTWIATIGIGYAQVLPRYLGNCGEVLIKGKRYRIAGNVTMIT
jgi:alanine racemase